MSAPRVVVVGDAGLDVVARHQPIVPGGDARACVRVTGGGAGANTATWLARCGAYPVLLARVGDDGAGRLVHDELARAGVHCAFTVDPDAATCCVVVLLDDAGQRSMLPDRGANARLHPDDVHPETLRGARHLHLSGYVLLDPSSRDAGLAALRTAREHGLSTSVDPQAAALITDAAEFLDMVRGTDLLLPNADELRVLTGSADPASAAGLLGTVGEVVVTSGPQGSAWIAGDGTTRVPAERAECVDSTGAGDAFDAGLLVSWLRGEPRRDALRAGNTAGTEAIRGIGAQTPSAPR